VEQSQATGSRPVRDASDLTASIRARLGEVLGKPPSGEIRRLSGGASRETYLCGCGSPGDVVLQIEHGGKPTGEPPGQAALLEAASHAGVPVAAVIAHGSDDPVLGAAWTVLKPLPGTTDPKQILPAAAAGDVPSKNRKEDPGLLDSIARALAAVHRMPADPALAPPVEEPLAQLRALHDRLGEPHPTFELAFRILGDDRPPARRTIVHGDFRMGNLMVDGECVSGVLDWELAHIGDPVEDLGWLCVPAWRFARPDLPAAGLGTREQLLTAYERHAGVAVPMAELRRWELAGTLRWGVICVMQAYTHLSGARRSIEHAVIGRRACEVEWDLLELLAPPHDASPAPAAFEINARPPAVAPSNPVAPRSNAAAPPAADGTAADGTTAGDPGASRSAPTHDECAPSELGPALHDRPTAIELLEAARGALGANVLPELSGRPAFELRVTLRTLGIVRRELERASEHAALHAAALSRLGVADERELAEAIRRGAFDGRDGALRPELRAIVRAKLEAANPAYLETYETTTKEGT
jgi:aminoglycoside phosphotransferase (APT) family kinase protein